MLCLSCYAEGKEQWLVVSGWWLERETQERTVPQPHPGANGPPWKAAPTRDLNRRSLSSPVCCSPLATCHSPLTPIIPALTNHFPVSPIIPALTQNIGGGGCPLQNALAHNSFVFSRRVNYILNYMNNYIVGAPTFLECGGLPPLLRLTQRRVMNGLRETMASQKREQAPALQGRLSPARQDDKSRVTGHKSRVTPPSYGGQAAVAVQDRGEKSVCATGEIGGHWAVC